MPCARATILVWTFLLALSTGCRVVQRPQSLASDGPVHAKRLSDHYALTTTEAGTPLALWDLGYPVTRRIGDEDRPPFPVRLVNFHDPREPAARLRAERWKFGVRSFFAGLVTLNVAKWYQTTDLFDVREIRAARQARLNTWIQLEDPSLFAQHGLTSEDLQEAQAQLGFTERESHPPRLTPLGQPATSAMGAWGYRLLEPEGVHLEHTTTGDQLTVTPTRDEVPSDPASLTASTIGATAIITGGFLVQWPIGLPFSIFTSIFPFAPFRSQDPRFAERGELLALMETDQGLPSELEPYREQLRRTLDDELSAANSYWPPDTATLLEANWTWLASRCSARGEP